jgi:SAM-dependent methyltransferase
MLDNKQLYTDQSENFLLDLFDKPQSQKQKEIYKILSKNPSWPILYHLSPQRKWILEWYPFDKNSSLLEVGAGCGAVTEVFLKKLKSVVANELTEDRATIIKKRYSNYKNLNVKTGNFVDMKNNQRFDYVTAIGVLEYSGKYIDGKSKFYDPFKKFLLNVKKVLKTNGHFLLAIENKIGLKYFSGGKEDHYGDLFSSIENYPNYNGVRTFSKEEIITLLKNSGFNKLNFYYPYPDYKLPNTILTDEGFNLNVTLSSFASIVDFSNERLPLFNEVISAYSLKSENILGRFSNSFLIDCQI